MDQNRLAWDESRMVEQHLPGGDRNHRHGRRFDEAEPAGLKRNHRRGSESIFRIRAGEACVGDAEHLVPRLEGDDGRPDRLDHTGKVGAEGKGQRLR